MNLQQLTNVAAFMRRVTMTGDEAFTWVDIMLALKADAEALSAPPLPQPSADEARALND